MNAAELSEMASAGTLIGVFDGISNDDYHQGPGYSNSSLDGAEQSGQHWEASRRNRKESKAMLEGTLLHEFCLEPHKVESWVVLPDSFTLLGKDHQAEMSRHPGRRCVPKDVIENLKKIDENLRKLPLWQLCLSSGFKELAGYAKCPRTGLLRKCKPDVYLPEQKWLVDLKKTQDASEAEFARSCANFNYHRQGAFHVDTFNEATAQSNKRKLGFEGPDVVTAWIAIACEWNEPWGVRAWALDEESLTFGHYEYEKGLDVIAECIRDSSPKGYPTDIGTLRLPGWKLRA
jgi:hypothetical protein